MPSGHQPDTGAFPGRQVVVAVVLMAILGGILFWMTRRHPEFPAPLPEVHRQNLELRSGRWYPPGQTKGFTGFLFDTYDQGTKKSRSAVSNGLLQGLSQGWHTNGQLQVQEYFVAGTSHGVRTKWHPNGQKLSEVTIVGGKLQGLFRTWDEQGRRAEEVELQDGLPEGVSRAYFPSGFVKTEVRLQAGKVLESKSWPDGERAAAR